MNNTLGIIADQAGSTGTATVDGAGSRWTNSSDFYVGHFGNGTLTIRNGGAVSNDFGFVGRYSSSTSTATVDGTGSTWTSSSDLNVGASGTGTLTIRNGGAVSNGTGTLGDDPGATGAATVDGAGSTWTNSGKLYVGNSGSGTLTIRNGGAVSNGYGFLGNNPGATGAATVDGAGSTWTNGGDLFVGAAGGGTLTIRNGGAVRNSSGVVGNNFGGTGAATVDGAGSTWTNSSELYVGASGDGTLIIRNGGAVSNGIGYIGMDSGTTGAATVDGTGSTWTNSADLNVGYLGTGTLTIRNGGSVSASTVSIASQVGSTGTLNIGAASGQAAVAPGTLNTASVDFGDGTGQIVFNHTATNYVFAPVITSNGAGSGTVRVEAGTTILTATSTYTGPTVIDGGTLSVNGSIAGSAVTVNAGGTLGGNGTVGNTIINGGTLAPGNSIGLLTVNGNLSFSAASSYIGRSRLGNADRVNVTGTATLSGATVNASFAVSAGSQVVKQYTILNASGGLGGSTFGSVVNTNLPSGFKSSLSYDANNAYLNLALNFTAPPGGTLNGNQQGVGNAVVNFFNRTGGIPLAFGGLTPAGLTQISGETAAGSQQATFDAMTQFMGVMTDPFTAGRGFDAGAGATSFAEEGFRPSSTLRRTGRVPRASVTPTPRSTARRRSATLTTHAGACGRPALAVRRPPRATRPGIEHGNQPRVRRRHGRRLSAVAAHHRRLRARRRRHQFQRRQWRLRAIRPVPGRRLHQAQSRRGLHHRRRRLWLAGRHHRSHRDDCRHRPAARELQRQRLLGPHRRRQSLRDAVDGWSWPDALCRRAGDELRSAGLCRKRARRRHHLRALLRCQERHRDA